MTEATPIRMRAVAGFMLAAGFFAYAFTLRVQPSVIVADLMRDFAVGAAALGGLSAFYFYAYAGVQVPVGMLMDRYGPRRLMAAALLVCALGSALFAWAPGIEMAAAGRVLVGAGAAFGFLGALTVAAQGLPARRFGLLSGITQGVGMAGAILGQAPYRWLVDTTTGWREATLWLAGVGVILAIAIYAVVRDMPRSNPSGPVLAEKADATPARGGGAGSVLRNLQTWAASLTSFLMTATLLAFAGLWAVPFLVQGHGMGNAEAAGLVSLFFIGWAVGSVGAGWVSDRIGLRRPPLMVGAALGLAALSGFIYLGDPRSALGVGLLVVAGFGCGAMILTYALARESNDPRASSTAMGLINTATVGSGAVMQPVIGVLLERGWDGRSADGVPVYGLEAFQDAFLVLPAGLAVALAVILFVLRETGPGRG